MAEQTVQTCDLCLVTKTITEEKCSVCLRDVCSQHATKRHLWGYILAEKQQNGHGWICTECFSVMIEPTGESSVQGKLPREEHNTLVERLKSIFVETMRARIAEKALSTAKKPTGKSLAEKMDARRKAEAILK